MTDLEKIEVALRRAMSAPNPHAKCEIYFRNFVAELAAMNNARHEVANELWRLYEREKKQPEPPQVNYDIEGAAILANDRLVTKPKDR